MTALALAYDFDAASLAAAYDDVLVPRLFAPWASDLVRAVAPRRGENALDLACGPGTVASVLAAAVGPSGSVVAIDASADMLAVARSRTQDGASARITFLHASAETFAVRPRTFDVVTCQQGLQFFSDRAAALSRIHASLAPGGRFAASVWCRVQRCEIFAALGRALARAAPALEPFTRVPFAGPDATTLAYEVEAVGFRGVVVTEEEKLFVLEGGARQAMAVLDAMPVGSVIAAMPAAARERIARAVASELAPLVQRDGKVAAPMRSTVLVTRRT